MKAYCKALELARKKRDLLIPVTHNTPALRRLAEELLRFEAVFRLKRLKRLFKDQTVSPNMLSPMTLATMFMDLLDTYDLKGKMRRPLSPDELFMIRLPYRLTVAHWQHGVDLRSLYRGDEKSLKSHRRVIMKEYGIDIYLPSPRSIELPVELGEILRAENFVAVPAEIKSDPELFYRRDMQTEWNSHTRDLGKRGPNSIYINPYATDEDDEGGHE